MPLTARSHDNADFEPIPRGTQQAICILVEDLGTHIDTYDGRQTRKRQVAIVWELMAKITKGEKAGAGFNISSIYTLSLGRNANLRRDLENWRSKPFTAEELDGFDLEKLKGANCLLNIVEHTKANNEKSSKVGAIMPLPQGMAKMQWSNTECPKWIEDKRNQSIEVAGEPAPYNEQPQQGGDPAPDNGTPTDGFPQDDLPF